jgi:hypothetical protein
MSPPAALDPDSHVGRGEVVSSMRRGCTIAPILISCLCYGFESSNKLTRMHR